MMNNNTDNNNNEYTNSTYFQAENPFCTDPADGASNNAPAKKKKSHRFMKFTAGLMAMALVSTGSIAVYRQFDDHSESQVQYTATDENAVQAVKHSALKADSVSLIAPVLGGEELTTEQVVQKVLPSVVGIESEFTFESSNNGYYFGGFGFGYDNSVPSTQSGTATGTGVIISEDGYIVTNAHVIYDTEYNAGLADNISVLLNDGDSYDAKIIGYDTDCDIAVLKIDANDLTAAEFGDSDALNLGQSVVAIGNPLGFDLMDTVTAGIISGLNRQITINDKSMKLLQTDAAINSGNSGGPLINKYGQVIGINSSKMSSSYGTASIEGIGFAIPSNDVSRIVDDIMEHGYVTGKPQLGISCQNVTEQISQAYNLPVGVYVTEVSKGSAAEKAGLKSGDVITAFDGEEVETIDELNAKKNLHSAGDEIELTYIRSGKEEKVSIVLDENTNNKK